MVNKSFMHLSISFVVRRLKLLGLLKLPFVMGKTVAVAAKRDTFLDLLLYSAPGITVVHHA